MARLKSILCAIAPDKLKVVVGTDLARIESEWLIQERICGRTSTKKEICFYDTRTGTTRCLPKDI